MQPAIPADLVHHVLDAVCGSAQFARSPRHQRLLRYLVEELLAGRVANLREIHLGVHVFGRAAASFDPAADAIVRVEANRLRARLDRYYASEAPESRVIIELPVGSYVPLLRWPAAQAVSRDGGDSLPVVAVLPLDALGGGDDVVLWSDALTDEITDALARLQDVRVVARTSVVRFKADKRDIREIAHVLSANALIEGSLQREGTQLRAIVQIITANDGLHLWSDSVNGSVDARFQFFDTVTAMVSRAIPLVIHTLQHRGAARPLPMANTQEASQSKNESVIALSPEVHDAYERGRIAIRVRTTTSIAHATALFSEVTAAAPDFARGHAAHATALLQEVGMTMRSAADTAAAIRASVSRALSIDPQSPEAHATLGIFQLYYEHDWPGAERSLLRAIHFGPSYVSARRTYAFGLMLMRRFAEADASFLQARTLDPLDTQTRVHHGLLRFYERRFDDARAVFQGMLDTDDNNVLARTLLAATCLQAGDVKQAERLYRDTCTRHPELSIGLCGLAVTLAIAGRIPEAKNTRKQLVAFSEKSFVSPYQFAMVDCALGNDRAAMAALEEAATKRDYNFLCSAVDPTFDRLHHTPAWRALMQRTGMPHD
jgi:TolB-like protein/Tfp pilus assembly protein PilF